MDDRTLVPSSGSDLRDTQEGARLGTPAYMSPEQAAGRIDQLGPASDVYSLGATLYCLLTGRAPFQEGDLAEQLRKVEHGEFVPPRQVRGWIDPALEAICRKAMRTDPAQRYDSPRSLADDVEHWLADEPVAAYPESVSLRVKRWMRKHPSRVTAAAVLLLATVVGLTAGTALLTVLNRQIRVASAEAHRQRDLARSNFQMARQAVDDYFVQVSENKLLKSDQQGLQPLREELLKSDLKYYQEFVRQTGDDPEVRAELAHAYFRVANITLETGSTGEARMAYLRAQELYQAISQTHPEKSSYQNDLARAYRGLGRLEASEGRYVEASDAFTHAIEVGERMVARNPEVPEFQSDLAYSYNNLGVMILNRGDPAASRRAYEQAIRTWDRLVEKHPIAEYRNGLGITYSNLGENLIAAGRLSYAYEKIRNAIELNEMVVQENPANQLYRKRLAESHEQLARQRLFAGKAGEAQEACQRALAISAPLARDNPAVIDYQERLISNHIILGHVLLASGQDPDAQRSFQTALELGNKLSRGTPNYFSYVSIHRGLGKVHRKQGRTGAALEALQKAVHIGETNAGGEMHYTSGHGVIE
jgi:serine/threonine-protein kinase